jgi:hypothetical protein
MQWNQLLTQGLNVLGTVALVFYSFPCAFRSILLALDPVH